MSRALTSRACTGAATSPVKRAAGSICLHTIAIKGAELPVINSNSPKIDCPPKVAHPTSSITVQALRGSILST
jgi:hypothetical protein